MKRTKNPLLPVSGTGIITNLWFYMEDNKKIDSIDNYARSINRLMIILVVGLIITGLYVGKAFIIPFIVALVIFFIMVNFENLISKGITRLILFFTKKGFSKRIGSTISVISFVLSLMISVFMLYFMYTIISSNFDDMLSNSARYQTLFNGKITKFNNFVNNSNRLVVGDDDISPLQKLISMMPKTHQPVISSRIIEEINFNRLFNTIGGFAGKSIANFTLVLIYLLFLYSERRSFRRKIEKIRRSNSKFEKFDIVMKGIGADLVEYFNIKTIISVVTAGLCYWVMSWFDLDFVWLWACIIFVLNYIPTVGSIVATIFPVALGFIIFDDVSDTIFMTLSLTAIQFVMGSVIEPKFQGNRLNLAPIIILLSLAVWGAIWGVVGMLLSVPIMVAVNAVLSQFEETKPLAMFFSSSGDIRSKKRA